MVVDPCQNCLFEVGVVQAALSCFCGPPSRICRLVLFEFGYGMFILPGSGMPFLGAMSSRRGTAPSGVAWGVSLAIASSHWAGPQKQGVGLEAVSMPCQAVPRTRLCTDVALSSEEGCLRW